MLPNHLALREWFWIPMGLQPFAVVAQPALQQHLEVLHPSPVDLKEVSEDVFFCNISHQQVLSRTPPFCNSCRQSILAFLRLGILVLGSLGIGFVQIKTQTQNRFCTKETKQAHKLVQVDALEILCNIL